MRKIAFVSSLVIQGIRGAAQKTRGFFGEPACKKNIQQWKEESNFSLQPGQSITFTYRIVVHSGETLTKDDMNKFSVDFEKVK